MKLELKHLAPYLPYRLMGETSENTIHEMTIVFLRMHLEPVSNIGRKITFKPILRPLSDLVVDIEHNNETLHPLYELNQMRGVTTEFTDYKFYIEGLDGFSGIETTSVYGCKFGDHDFHYEKETASFYNNSGVGLSPQLDMFQKLFEWHFDVFGLIEAGLAKAKAV